MTDSTTLLDPRRREAHPERIDVGSDVLVRNDICAKIYGVTMKTLDQGDRKGAPFIIVGAVKYRPEKLYREYVLSTIKVRGQAPQRRRIGGGR
jgi:hypothetical protein